MRDLSHTAVSISPADFSSWHDVRTELMAEAKKGFKARLEAELAAAAGQNLAELKAAFSQEERAIEHNIDHEVHNFSATVDVSYNVRRLPFVELFPEPIRSLTPSRFPVTVPLAVSTAARVRRAFR